MARITRFPVLLFLAASPALGATPQPSFYQRGAIYLDWHGSRFQDGTFFNQASVRIRFDLINRPGQGWTLSLDGRDRLGIGESPRNQVILYSARLTYDKAGSPFYLSVGQMNLYDTSGIGALLGGMAGFRIARDILVGGYGGFESSPYINRLETDYLKFGAFARWTGAKGKSFALSYNQLQFAGKTERRYAYANLFLPVERVLVLYGDLEYELGNYVAGENRLSRIFVNARFDLSRWADLTGSYSQGKGLDFHRFLMEASQDPALLNQDVERFYYTGFWSVRLSVKPRPNLRLSAGRQESEQKDLAVLNKTWRFSVSGWNLLGKGLGFTADYALNNGTRAESDSYYASLTKDFGRFSLTGSFSNTFNGFRFDPASGDPVPIRLSDYQNVSLSALVRISPRLSASVEYAGLLQEAANHHYLFVRLVYRTH